MKFARESAQKAAAKIAATKARQSAARIARRPQRGSDAGMDAGGGAGSSSSTGGPHSRSMTAVWAAAAATGGSRPVRVSSRSSSWPRPFPEATTVSSISLRPPARRNRTTVMLSSPPAWFAAFTSPLPACSRSRASVRSFRIVVVRHHRRQPVRTEEEEIAVLDRDRERVDVHLGVGSERARDHGPLWMRVRLLRREPSAPDEIGDEGVILGQLLEAPGAQAVRARVAHVADGEHVVSGERRGDRRPHPRDLRVARGALVDPPVRLLDDGDEPFLGLEPVGVVELSEGGRRQARRDLARLGAAHPVGDREERRVDDEGVLVPPPFPARIGEPCAVGDLHRSNLSSVSPIWTRSPRCSWRRP